jgi:hypothetical protein
MPEILHLGQKHQTGKDGIGKGSAIRRGSNKKLYDANYDAVFGKKGANAANDPAGSSGSRDNGRRNRCPDSWGTSR